MNLKQNVQFKLIFFVVLVCLRNATVYPVYERLIESYLIDKVFVDKTDIDIVCFTVSVWLVGRLSSLTKNCLLVVKLHLD